MPVRPPLRIRLETALPLLPLRTVVSLRPQGPPRPTPRPHLRTLPRPQILQIIPLHAVPLNSFRIGPFLALRRLWHELRPARACLGNLRSDRVPRARRSILACSSARNPSNDLSRVHGIICAKSYFETNCDSNKAVASPERN